MGRFASLLVLSTSLALAPAAFAGDGGPFRFETFASGAQEVLAVETDTSARLKLRFARDLSAARFDLRVFDGESITQAHLHCARAGVNGPVVAFLFNIAPVPGPGGIDVDGRLSRGTLTNDDIEPAAFEDNPACGVAIVNIASLQAAVADGLIYLNVHSEGNPPGEVRGQLLAAQNDEDREDDD